MLIKTLADVEALVVADGLDLDAVALIVSEALGEDLGGRGVLPPGAGPGIDVTSYATIEVRTRWPTVSSSPARRARWPGSLSPRTRSQ